METEMKFASTRIIANDPKVMVAFYEMVTETKANWLAPVFAEFVLPGAALAISSAQIAPQTQKGITITAGQNVIFEFQVENVDAEYARLKDKATLILDLQTMPWGNKTFQLRDPEGNAVALYMPETEVAKQRFAGR
jgi:uncharacterized glyoxalase superfamily protein PhnB